MNEEPNKKNHLIVLLHGLWGSSKNLSRLESVLHHTLDDSKVCKFHTYSPECFPHFKTYDGVESIGNYIIPDLFNHLEKLSINNNIKIDEISFIGYSLGGLIGRYIIGELYEIGFFEKIKPSIFTTFATPHLGVTFYKNTILNFLGSNLLGQSGKDLFMCEKINSIIYKLSDPNEKYFKSLNLFDRKICIANAKFDRTVGFYSAFITKFDIFNDWETVNPKFIENLPNATLKENNKLIECLILNLNDSTRLDSPISNNLNSSSRKFSLLIVFSIGFLIFPIIFAVSLFATIKSYFRRNFFKKIDILKQWKLSSSKIYKDIDNNNNNNSDDYNDSNSISNLIIKDNNKNVANNDDYDESKSLKPNPIGISHITRDVVENGLNVIDNNDLDDIIIENSSKLSKRSDEIEKSYFIDVDFELDYKSRKSSVNSLLKNLDSSDLSNTPLSKNVKPLPFDDIREKILDNLNLIDWTKIVVLLNNLNAHQSVVGRRGFERTPESIPFLFLYSFLIEDTVRE